MSGALSAIGIGGTAAAGATVGGIAGDLFTGAAIGTSEAAAAAATSNIFSAGSLLSLAGTGLSALQQMRAGQAAGAAAKYNSAVENNQANAEEAASQRQAVGQNQQTQLLISRARSMGAASGASDTSPSIMSDETQIQNRGDLNAMMDLYNGESRAQALREGASLQNYQGDQAESTAPLRALSTIMQGASSLYTRYSPSPFGTALDNPY